MAAKKLGFNKYAIKGDITEFYITNKKGINFTVIIDTNDLQKLIDLDYCWHTVKRYNCYYVTCCNYLGSVNGKVEHEILLLHNVIMGIDECDPQIQVDHENHDTLDNRKCNLRVIEDDNNKKYRKGANSNNKTGIRNVCIIDGWYTIQIQDNGKNKIVAKTKDKDDARKLAIEARDKYYGDFAGEG
jgi:hypothetical protein